jgi:glycosyltransferase involved in cell wall biosynthesis
LWALLLVAVTRPLHFIDALKVTVRMGRLSDRGILRHLAYLVEACTLLGILKQHNIQHVHVHFGTNVATVARLIKRCGGPGYSFTVHGPTEFDSAIGFDLSGKISDAAFVLAITDYCSAQLRRWCIPADWEKIHVVRCTVGDDFFDAFEPFDPQCRTFTCVGRLTPQKGQITLIDAFARLIKTGHDADLVFVGDGELRGAIEEKIKSAGLENHVTITGYVSESEVRRQLIASRVMVLPSFAEGLPMVIMEAFAVGRPVISTYIAGIPELVYPEQNGWLVPAGSTDRLVTALVEALKTPTERLGEMASAGRNRTFEQHRTVTEGERLEQILWQYVAK